MVRGYGGVKNGFPDGLATLGEDLAGVFLFEYTAGSAGESLAKLIVTHHASKGFGKLYGGVGDEACFAIGELDAFDAYGGGDDGGSEGGCFEYLHAHAAAREDGDNHDAVVGYHVEAFDEAEEVDLEVAEVDVSHPTLFPALADDVEAACKAAFLPVDARGYLVEEPLHAFEVGRVTGATDEDDAAIPLAVVERGGVDGEGGGVERHGKADVGELLAIDVGDGDHGVVLVAVAYLLHLDEFLQACLLAAKAVGLQETVVAYEAQLVVNEDLLESLGQDVSHLEVLVELDLEEVGFLLVDDVADEALEVARHVVAIMLEDAVDLEAAVVGSELEVEGATCLVEEEPWMDELATIGIGPQIDVGPQLLQLAHSCARVVGVLGKDERDFVVISQLLNHIEYALCAARGERIGEDDGGDDDFHCLRSMMSLRERSKKMRRGAPFWAMSFSACANSFMMPSTLRWLT